MPTLSSQRFGSARVFSPRGALPILALVLAVTLSGCYQAVNENVNPTRVDLQSLPTSEPLTATPFVTPLPASGFAVPTDDPNRFLTATAGEPPTAENAVPPTAAPQTNPQTAPQDTPQGGQLTVPTDQPTDASLTQPIQNVATTPPPPTAVLATPTALPTEGPCIHTVQPGEWFYSIARKYNLSPADLLAANPRHNPDSLQPGDVLNIPHCNQPTAVPAVPPTSTPQSLLPPPTGGAVAAPSTPIPLSGREYSVAAGDTLGGIARKFNTTVKAIENANALPNDFLSVGQILKIPAPTQ